MKDFLPDHFSRCGAPFAPPGYSQIHAIATLVIGKSGGSDLPEV